jgi:ParB family chromosome partitioning protein
MSAAARKGLGRGLGALISDNAMPPVAEPTAAAPKLTPRTIKKTKAPTPAVAASPEVPSTPAPPATPTALPISRIRANTWQPRHAFEDEALEELAASVRVHGIIQPLIVRPVTGTGNYELIAGERRLRAAQRAELTEVPVVIREASELDSLQVALIENLQREDLNPIEEAEGYHQLSEEFDLTQEDISERMGKSRASVANALRLLSLPEEVRAMLADRRLSSGHGKLLAGLDAPTTQLELARRTVSEELTVRKLESAVTASKKAPSRRRAPKSDIPATHLSYLSDRLHSYFGTSVRISPCRTKANGKKVRGAIEINYFSNDELDRILGLLGMVGDED